MKKGVWLISTAIMMTGATLGIRAQCTPDTVNCVDTGEPGEFCPKNLPAATVDVAYDETITIIAPGSFNYLGSTIPIAYIIVDSVLNLPEGIGYQANAVKFYPDTAYCVQISGVPGSAGDFPLSIYVSAFIAFANDTILAAQVNNDTSVVMTVLGSSAVNPFRQDPFQVLQTAPNPFSETTKIGFYTPYEDRVTLRVYNILGKQVHEETEGVTSGEHYFRFDGGSLQPGTYFYRISNKERFYTGKFIKSR